MNGPTFDHKVVGNELIAEVVERNRNQAGVVSIPEGKEGCQRLCEERGNNIVQCVAMCWCKPSRCDG